MTTLPEALHHARARALATGEPWAVYWLEDPWSGDVWASAPWAARQDWQSRGWVVADVVGEEA